MVPQRAVAWATAKHNVLWPQLPLWNAFEFMWFIRCDPKLEDLMWWMLLKWCREMCRPMCEIQEVARTQSVQSIKGNSPLSISSQIFESIWFLDSWSKCQNIVLLSPFSHVFILISICELLTPSEMITSQKSFLRQQKHFIESLKASPISFPLISHS